MGFGPLYNARRVGPSHCNAVILRNFYFYGKG